MEQSYAPARKRIDRRGSRQEVAPRGWKARKKGGTTSIIRNPSEFSGWLAARSELGHRGPRRMEELDVEKPTGESLSSFVHFPGGRGGGVGGDYWTRYLASGCWNKKKNRGESRAITIMADVNNASGSSRMEETGTHVSQDKAGKTSHETPWNSSTRLISLMRLHHLTIDCPFLFPNPRVLGAHQRDIAPCFKRPLSENCDANSNA